MPQTWAFFRDPMETAPTALRAEWQSVLKYTSTGNFSKAQDSLRTAGSLVAKVRGDQLRAEISRRLRCAEIALRVEDNQSAPLQELRSLLMNAESLATQVAAAYQLGHAFEEQRDWKKAYFYGKRALSAAETSGEKSWQAVAHNLLGNVCAGDSLFQAAQDHYDNTLALRPSNPLWLGQVHDNLGYVLAAQGMLDESRGHLARALFLLRRNQGAARLSVELDTAFLLCLTQHAKPALRHALVGLKLARELQDTRNTDNALMLVLEGAKRTGNRFLARRCADELAHSKGQPDFSNVLYGLDLLNVVNLKA